MRRSVNLKAIVLFIAFCLPLIACGSGEKNVTSIEQILGTWEGETTPGQTFIMSIKSDGTVKLAKSLEDLNKGHTDTHQLWFENEQIMLHIPVICSEVYGVYQAVIKPDAKLRFTVIDDPCDYRVSRFSNSIQGSLIEYEVEFTLIDNQ